MFRTKNERVPGDGKASKWTIDFVKSKGDTIHMELPIYSGDYNYLPNYKSLS